MKPIQINQNKIFRDQISDQKYSLIRAEDFAIPTELRSHFNTFMSDWENLEADDFLKAGASFRFRRFGLFEYLPDQDVIRPSTKDNYFQSEDINEYAGGVKRRFAPLSEDTFENPFLFELIKVIFRNFPIEEARKKLIWDVDVHQVRILGSIEELGEATPEGIHHDGEEFISVHLFNRKNVNGGVSGIYDNDQKLIESLTLKDPMDSILIWDPFVMHGVSPIKPENLDDVAIRDTLLVGFNPQN